MESVAFNSDVPFEQQLDIFTQAMDGASCGISIADANQKDMPLIYVNEGFEKITGYSREEVIGKNCRFLQQNMDNVDARKQIRSALRRKASVTVVLSNKRKDGVLFYNELHLRPLSSNGVDVTHYVGIQTDVSYRYA